MDESGPAVPDAAPPLAVDIDGTLTDDARRLDPRVMPVLRAWPAPVVVATGKAMPYPVALCEFLGVDVAVIAENGGVVLVAATDYLHHEGDPEAARAVAEAYGAEGHDLGWGTVDPVNRWRETEVAVSLASPRGPLEVIAAEHGLEVVDTGYAYHVKSPDVSKGVALERVAGQLDRSPGAFAAVGDSTNDAPAFERAGVGIAVANADETAREAADHVTDAAFADGFLEAAGWIGEHC
jgi:phosphoglycolate phosphatase (TIGR01487 family)